MDQELKASRKKKFRIDVVMSISILVLYLIVFGNIKGNLVSNIFLCLFSILLLIVIVRHFIRTGIFDLQNQRSTALKIIVGLAMISVYVLFQTYIIDTLTLRGLYKLIGIVGRVGLVALGSLLLLLSAYIIFRFFIVQKQKGRVWLGVVVICIAGIFLIKLLVGPGTIYGSYKSTGPFTAHIFIKANGSICQEATIGNFSNQRCGTYKYDDNTQTFTLSFDDGLGPTTAHLYRDVDKWELEWGNDNYKQIFQY